MVSKKTKKEVIFSVLTIVILLLIVLFFFFVVWELAQWFPLQKIELILKLGGVTLLFTAFIYITLFLVSCSIAKKQKEEDDEIERKMKTWTTEDWQRWRNLTPLSVEREAEKALTNLVIILFEVFVSFAIMELIFHTFL